MERDDVRKDIRSDKGITRIPGNESFNPPLSTPRPAPAPPPPAKPQQEQKKTQ